MPRRLTASIARSATFVTPVASMTLSKPRGAMSRSSLQICRHMLEAEFVAGAVEPALIDVDDGDQAGAVVASHLGIQQTHRASAIDEVRLAGLRLQPVEAAHYARDRLDQGGGFHRHRLWDRIDDSRGNIDVFGEAAGVMADADGVPTLAQVAHAALAVVAGATVEGRIDTDAITNRDACDVGAYGNDFATELVTDDDGVDGGRKLAVDDVNVGAANSTRTDFDHDLFRAGRRLEERLQLQ